MGGRAAFRTAFWPAGLATLHVAGQTAADDESVSRRVISPSSSSWPSPKSLRSSGPRRGEPQHVARMTIYVTDLDAYRAARRELGDVWRRHMGSHYPAMALVGVTGWSIAAPSSRSRRTPCCRRKETPVKAPASFLYDIDDATGRGDDHAESAASA